MLRVARVAGAFLLLASTAHAQLTTVEVGRTTQALSGSYQDGGSIGVRIRHERPRHVWYAGAAYESRFGESGVSGYAALQHALSDRWSTFVSAAGSSEVFFLPRYRFEAQLTRKFGSELRWAASALVMTSAAHDEHSDVGVGAGLMRYFRTGFVAEGRLQANRSSPGAVWGTRQMLAVSWLRPQERVLSLRAGYGDEAYQLTGANVVLVDFHSFELGARWDEWVGQRWGVSLGAEYYENPSYNRFAHTLSVFYQFGR